MGFIMNKVKKVVVLSFLLSSMMHSVMHADDAKDRIVGGIAIALGVGIACLTGYYCLYKKAPNKVAPKDESSSLDERQAPRPSSFNEGYEVGGENSQAAKIANKIGDFVVRQSSTIRSIRKEEIGYADGGPFSG